MTYLQSTTCALNTLLRAVLYTARAQCALEKMSGIRFIHNT
jgi:hypothetical protein